MAKTEYTKTLIVTHTVIILLAYSSPFWLDWKLVLLGVALDYIQIIVAGGCVLSLAQFDDKQMTFHEWYLRKLGIRVNRPKFNFVLRYIVPLVILAAAVLFQVVANNRSLITV